MKEITATELKQRFDSGEDVQLIDVREQREYDHVSIPGAKLIPLGQIIQRMDELDPSREIVMQCKMGGRSAQAIMALQAAGYGGEMANLRGGITAWSDDVDPNVPKY